jgi:MFS family permease
MIALRENRNLLLLWAGQFISQTGDFLFQAAVLFLVLTIEPTYGALKAGIASTLETIPFLIFGLLAGSLVDRYRRRQVMLLSDAARGLLLLTVPLLWGLGWLSWATIGLIAFLLSSFSTLFNPARDALIPQLVPHGRLVQANALIQTSTQGAMILGTFLAGTLLGLQKAAGSAEGEVLPLIRLLVLDGLTFFISFGAVWLIRVDESHIAALGSRSEKPSAWQEALDGLRYAMRSPVLRGLLLLTAVDNFFIMGPAVVGANLFIKNTLELEAQHLAFFEAALAVGWFLGTLWMGRYGKRLPKGKLLLIGIVMDGATYLPFLIFLAPDVRSYGLALVLIVIHGLFIPLITVSRTSLIQEIVPATHLGRVFALVNLTVVGFMALSSFTTGALGEVLGAPYLFGLAGAGGALSGLLGMWVFPALRKHD